MCPFVLERIGDLAQMRIDVCEKLPANHPFQPTFIQPLQTIAPDEQFGGEQSEPASDNPETTSSSKPNLPKPVIHLFLMNCQITIKVSYLVSSLTQRKPLK